MAIDIEAVRQIARDYVLDVKNSMQIDKAVLFGSYAKGTPSEYSDVDICFFSSGFENQNKIDILTRLLGIARKYHPGVCIEPQIFATSQIYNDNPFVKEVLRTGYDIG